MHIAFRLLAVLALAAGALPQSAIAQDDARGIVLAALRTEEGEVALEPIATLIEGGGFGRPQTDPAEEGHAAFQARWMRPGARYDLLSRGEHVGSAGIERAEPAPEGCAGMMTWGAPRVREALPEGWQGLAGTGLPDQPDAPWLRAPTAAEGRALDVMAADLFRAHGIDLARYTQGDTAAFTLLYHPNARPVLVASYRRTAQGPLLRRASMLIVAEERENGYRPTLAWFHDAEEGDMESRELVDAADLDGDGRPELVVRNTFYESWTYTLLTRAPGGWREIYHGGGGGC